MAADEQFYREYILDHYKNPRNFGKIEEADISHEELNPLCGDVVGMDLRLRGDVIEDVKFHGRGCAISQASPRCRPNGRRACRWRRRARAARRTCRRASA